MNKFEFGDPVWVRCDDEKKLRLGIIIRLSDSGSLRHLVALDNNYEIWTHERTLTPAGPNLLKRIKESEN